MMMMTMVMLFFGVVECVCVWCAVLCRAVPCLLGREDRGEQQEKKRGQKDRGCVRMQATARQTERQKNGGFFHGNKNEDGEKKPMAPRW
jgi:hypothetical protein